MKLECVFMRMWARVVADIGHVFTADNWGWSRHWLIISYCAWISDGFNALAECVKLKKKCTLAILLQSVFQGGQKVTKNSVEDILYLQCGVDNTA